MKLLIIGGTGTISTPIVEAALEAGHRVTLLNRGNRSAPEGVELLQADRNDPQALDSALRGRAFDCTVDMVCFRPEQLESLTRVLPDHGQLVFCSTVCAIGFEWTTWPVPESTACRPHSEYGRGKAAAESWLRDYGETTGKPYTILRPSTTYDHRTGLLRQVCLDGFRWLGGIRQGHPLLIADSGMGINQFMHAADCGRAFSLTLGRESCIGKTYNVVGPATTWAEHHRTAMRAVGRDVPLISAPTRTILNALDDNPIFSEIFQYHGFFCGDRLFQDTGFQPEISLETGMRQVVETLDSTEKIPKPYRPEPWETSLLKGSGR